MPCKATTKNTVAMVSYLYVFKGVALGTTELHKCSQCKRGSTAMTMWVFHGECGGSADRGDIRPLGHRRPDAHRLVCCPTETWKWKCTAKICQWKHRFKIQSQFLVCCKILRYNIVVKSRIKLQEWLCFISFPWLKFTERWSRVVKRVEVKHRFIESMINYGTRALKK